jgi:hypothetical protein
MAEVAMEAVPVVMGGTAVMAELVVGPVVGDGLGAHGMVYRIAGYGGVAMVMQVGQDMADLTIGMASMATLLMHRCCAIPIQIVSMELVI